MELKVLQLSDEAIAACQLHEDERFRSEAFGATSDCPCYDITWGGRIKWEEILTPESYKKLQEVRTIFLDIEEIGEHLFLYF